MPGRQFRRQDRPRHFFDYDNDADMDVLIVNSSTLANMKHGGDPMVALFRNDGQGRFTDVTAASGLSARGRGMGTRVADYDRDGGRRTSVPPVTVQWPDGARERFEGLTPNRIHVIRQGAGR